MHSSSACLPPWLTRRTGFSAAAIGTSTEGGLRLTLSDGAVRDFRRLLDEQMTEAFGPALHEVSLIRTELLELAETVGECRAVEVDGDVAGYVWLKVRGRMLHIHALLLRRDFRGHGIGARTLQALEDEFRAAVDVVELGVHDADRPARALYERAGFREVERRPEIGFTILRKPLIAENP